MNFPRGLTMTSLRGNIDKNTLSTVLKNLISSIDNAITEADNMGFDTLAYSLPTSFGVRKLPDVDAQLVIYYEVLRMCRTPETEGGKGFINTTIDTKSCPPVLHLRWIGGLKPEEKTKMSNYIVMCSTPVDTKKELATLNEKLNQLPSKNRTLAK